MTAQENSHTHFYVAVYRREATALSAMERLVDRDFPMDRLSILGKALAKGDDVLGVYHPGVGERMKAWGAQGAFWGGVWGLLASAGGLFLVPGLGPILAAGPIVEAIAAVIAGASLTGGAMAVGAVLSQITVALHRLGVPPEILAQLQQAIEAGEYVVILQGGAEELTPYRDLMTPGAEAFYDLPGAELPA